MSCITLSKRASISQGLQRNNRPFSTCGVSEQQAEEVISTASCCEACVRLNCTPMDQWGMLTCPLHHFRMKKQTQWTTLFLRKECGWIAIAGGVKTHTVSYPLKKGSVHLYTCSYALKHLNLGLSDIWRDQSACLWAKHSPCSQLRI